MGLRGKTARGVFWVALQSVGQRSISFIVFVVLARLLEPEAFGLVALAAVFIAFVELFINIGFGEAIIQRRDLEKQHLDTAFWIILAIGVASSAISIVAAEQVANLFDEEKLAPVLRWMSIAIILTSLTRVQQVLLRREMKFEGLAIRTLVASLAGGVVGVSMALKGYGVWSLVGQNLASGLAGVLVLWSVSAWRPQFRVSREHGRDLFSFGINVMGSNIMHFFSSQIDRLLIGYFLDSTVLGYYTVALRLIDTIRQLLSQTLSTVLYSTFSRMQDNIAQLRRIFLSATQLVALLAFPTFMLFATMGSELVVVVFGEQWLPCVSVIRIVALAAMVGTIITFNAPVFKATGKPGLAFKVGLIHASLGLVLFAVSVHWGLVAMAMAWIIRASLVVPISVSWGCRLMELDMLQFVKLFRTPLVGSVGMAASVSTVRFLIAPVEAVYLLFAEISVAIVVYLIVVYWMEPDLLRRALELGRLAMPGNDASKRAER